MEVDERISSFLEGLAADESIDIEDLKRLSKKLDEYYSSSVSRNNKLSLDVLRQRKAINQLCDSYSSLSSANSHGQSADDETKKAFFTYFASNMAIKADVEGRSLCIKNKDTISFDDQLNIVGILGEDGLPLNAIEMAFLADSIEKSETSVFARSLKQLVSGFTNQNFSQSTYLSSV